MVQRVEFQERLAAAADVRRSTVIVAYEVHRIENGLKLSLRGKRNVHLVLEDMLAIAVCVASRLYGKAAAPTKQVLSTVPEESTSFAIARADAPLGALPPTLPRTVGLLAGKNLEAALTGFIHHLADADDDLRAEITASPPTVTLTFSPQIGAEIAVPVGQNVEWRQRFISMKRPRRRKAAVIRHQAALTIGLFDFLAECWRDSRAAMASPPPSTAGGNSAPGKRSAAAPARAAASSVGVPKLPQPLNCVRSLPHEKNRIYPIAAAARVQGFQPAPPQRSLFDDPFVSE